MSDLSGNSAYQAATTIKVWGNIRNAYVAWRANRVAKLAARAKAAEYPTAAQYRISHAARTGCSCEGLRYCNWCEQRVRDVIPEDR